MGVAQIVRLTWDLDFDGCLFLWIKLLPWGLKVTELTESDNWQLNAVLRIDAQYCRGQQVSLDRFGRNHTWHVPPTVKGKWFNQPSTK